MAVYSNRSREIAKRLILLREYLYTNATPTHAVKIGDIMNFLESKGHKVKIKTAYSDLETLKKDFGLTLKYDGRQKGYLLYSLPPFSSYDLRLIVNSIQAAQFITQKEADRLTEQITDLADNDTRLLLNRQTYIPNRVRTIDNNLMRNLDIIYEAIAQERKISYKYFCYTNDRHNHRSYAEIDGSNIIVANPIGMIWTGDCYMFFSSIKKSDRKNSYHLVPVKQMEQIKILTDIRIVKPDARKAYNIFRKSFEDVTELSSATGRTRLRISNLQIPTVIEKFGNTAEITSYDDEYSTVTLNVYPTPEMYLWTLELGIKILYPVNADREFRNYFSDLLNDTPTTRPIFDDDF